MSKTKSFSFFKFLLMIGFYVGVFFLVDVWQDHRAESKAAEEAQAALAELEALLPSVPAELQSNIFLTSRGTGTCEALTGDVLLTVVFVDDADGSWTAEEMEEIKTQHLTVTQKLQAQAAEYNVDVNLSFQYLHALSSVEFVRDASSSWVESALSNLGLANLSLINYDLEEAHNVTETPILLYTHQQGRSFAIQQSSTLSAEYTILFQDTADYRHELYHLFGAEDFYYPEEVTALADLYLPGSIMMESDTGEVDDLTAYLIGWTDELSENALRFLNATNHLTPEDLKDAHAVETYTGFGTKTTESGTYTGDMLDGLFHGNGRFEWNDGMSYDGEWAHGVQTGYGTFTWANGNVYEGEWLNGAMHGTGTLTWAEGDIYSGEWTEGIRTGYGTYYWPNGDVYEGEWVDGVRTGQGTLTFANGIVWSGYWENNEFIG